MTTFQVIYQRSTARSRKTFVGYCSFCRQHNYQNSVRIRYHNSQIYNLRKKGPGRYVISLEKEGKGIKEYELIASTKQLERETVTYGQVDLIPKTWMYRSRNELSKRLLASECEWCGIRGNQVKVHHIRKLGNLEGKTPWERQMIERRRQNNGALRRMPSRTPRR